MLKKYLWIILISQTKCNNQIQRLELRRKNYNFHINPLDEHTLNNCTCLKRQRSDMTNKWHTTYQPRWKESAREMTVSISNKTKQRRKEYTSIYDVRELYFVPFSVDCRFVLRLLFSHVYTYIYIYKCPPYVAIGTVNAERRKQRY